MKYAMFNGWGLLRIGVGGFADWQRDLGEVLHEGELVSNLIRRFFRAAAVAALGIVFLTSAARAADQQPLTKLPSRDRISRLCVDISSQAESIAGNRYSYQDVIYGAASTTANSPDRNEKIKALWEKNRVRLICNNLQFDVADGNILKYAVVMLFHSFIYDVIDWGIPLNTVDQSDGKTVLDYVEDVLARSNGSPLQHYYEMYRRQLLMAGAKRARELTQEERIANARSDAAGYRLWSDAGDTAFMVRLARAYEDGYGVRASETEARKWLELAGETALKQQRRDAIWAARLLLKYDPSEAVSILERATQYDWQAAEALGDIFAEGKGIPQDYRSAVRWYGRADELNTGTGATTKLAWLYLRGLGTPQDENRAADLLMRTWPDSDAVHWLCANRRELITASHPDAC